MNTKNHEPTSLIEAVRHFSNLDTCDAYMAKLKWPTGEVCCPKCGCTSIGRIASRRMYQCKAKECRKQFSTKVGTIFEDSALSLDKWFVAVWSITNAKNGISSCELARALRITQKSAWFMLHRIRLAMKTGSFNKLGEDGTPVEIDESYIGGKSQNMHKSKREKTIFSHGVEGKTAVMGLLERNTKDKASTVRALVIPNRKSETLHPIIDQNVAQGAPIFTDSLAGYRGLTPRFAHEFVDHAAAYVNGQVHTNGMENFWSLLKRGLKGTYVRPTPKHLFRYLDEQIVRFNEREGNDADRFNFVMPNVVGRRITYKALIGDTEIGNAAN